MNLKSFSRTRYFGLPVAFLSLFMIVLLVLSSDVLVQASDYTGAAVMPEGQTNQPVRFRTVDGSVDNSASHKSVVQPFARPGGSALVQAGIQYHGGPVMTATKTIYVIWYGNWSGNTATTILPDLLRGLGGTSHFNINTTYTNSAGTPVSNSIAYGGSTTDSYSQGTSLTDAKIWTIVQSALNSGRLPRSSNAIYGVFTSGDVSEQGFLTQFCGWHTHGSNGGTDVKYMFVGDPKKNYRACAAQTTSPNGNTSADAMASVITHEIEETASDPDLNAWYDTSGNENADKCAWTFGSTSTLSNGAKYNLTFGGRNWYIQQNWLNVAPSGRCAKTY